MTRLPHHRSNCDGQVIGIAVDQSTDARIDDILVETGRAQAGDQRRQMRLMPMHAVQEFGWDFEGLRRARYRLKLIDTHRATLWLLRSDATIKRLTKVEWRYQARSDG